MLINKSGYCFKSKLSLFSLLIASSISSGLHAAPELSASQIATTFETDTYANEDLSIYNTYSGDPQSPQKLELRSMGGDESATYDLFVLNYRGYMVNINIPRAKKLLNACNSPKCKERKMAMSNNSEFNNAEEERPDPWRDSFSKKDADKNGLSDDAEQEAKSGNRHAQLFIGKALYESPQAEKKRIGLNWIYLAAQQKHNEARFLIGEAYEKGDVFKADSKAALHWYREILLDETASISKSAEIKERAKERIDALTKTSSVTVEAKKYTKVSLPTISRHHKVSQACDAAMMALKIQTATGHNYNDLKSASAETITNIFASNIRSENHGYVNDLGWSCNDSSKPDVVLTRMFESISPYPKHAEISWHINSKTNMVRLKKQTSF
ncbi:sel1 repeat family protein [Aeromonas veronii]|nr:sel1 repeat family protein [Aeromonas veronii]